MRLMAYVGIALAFSVPAKAVYVDGGIGCNTNEVTADAITQLDYWEVWGGWHGALAIAEIQGPSGYAGNWGWASDTAPAVANASISNPSAGTYGFVGWHYIYRRVFLGTSHLLMRCAGGRRRWW